MTKPHRSERPGSTWSTSDSRRLAQARRAVEARGEPAKPSAVALELLAHDEVELAAEYLECTEAEGAP